MIKNNPKKRHKGLLILIFLIAVCTIAGAQTKWGDVNGSNAVDIVDALMTAQYYVGLITVLPVQAAADVNGDSQINIVDALIIAQYSVGLITVFPVETKPTPTPTRTGYSTGGPTGPTLTPPGPRPSPARNVSLNGEFVLAYGETVAIPLLNILLTFKDVQDSRCPTGAVCVTEGEAVATLEMWAASYLGLATIKAPPAAPTNINKVDPAVGYYHYIRCTAITPYPDLNNPVTRDQYKISLSYAVAVP